MSSPANTSRKGYSTAAPNSYYDPDFTVEISKKMQVPDKIHLNQGMNGIDVLRDPAIIALKKVNDDAEWMRVPERICVVGGESHMTTREPPPEQKLEQSFLGRPSDFEQHAQLATPPTTLRIEDTEPVFETPVKKLDKALKSMESGRSAMKLADNRMNDSFLDYEDAELNSQSYLQIRRRLVQVSQRLDSLEIENRGRDKRDYLLYTSLFLYLLFRGIRFISSQNQF